jgi:hypothetical protein
MVASDGLMPNSMSELRWLRYSLATPGVHPRVLPSRFGQLRAELPKAIFHYFHY